MTVTNIGVVTMDRTGLQPTGPLFRQAYQHK